MTSTLTTTPETSTIVRSKRHCAVKKILGLTSMVNPLWGANLGLLAFTTPMQRRKQRPQLPVDTRVKSVSIRGREVTLYQYGKSARKILLVHGWEAAASDFIDLFEPLVKAGYEVCAVDLPGHGRSSGNRLTAGDTAEIIRDLEIMIGPFSAIVGHSFGAFSTGFALANYSEFDGMPFVSIGSPNTLKSVLENFSQLAGLSALQSNYMSCKIEKKYGIKVEDFELAKFIQSHSGPTMVVHDQQDRQVDYSEVEQIQQQARSADYLITKGLGHNRILNDPQTIHSIINFINRWRDSRDNFEIAFKFGIV